MCSFFMQKKCYRGMFCCPLRMHFWKFWSLKTWLNSSSPNWLNQSQVVWGRWWWHWRWNYRGRGAQVLPLKDWYWGFGLRDAELGSLRRVICSRKKTSPPGDNYSIHHVKYTVPVHLNWLYFSLCTHPIFPTEKFICFPNNIQDFTWVADNS